MKSDYSERFSLTLNCEKILSITEGQHLRLQTKYIIWTCEYRYGLQSIIFPQHSDKYPAKDSFIKNVFESQLEVPCWLISKKP